MGLGRLTLVALHAIVFAVVALGVLQAPHTLPEPKLTVMTSGGFTAASRTLFPEFERRAGCKIVLACHRANWMG